MLRSPRRGHSPSFKPSRMTRSKAPKPAELASTIVHASGTAAARKGMGLDRAAEFLAEGREVDGSVGDPLRRFTQPIEDRCYGAPRAGVLRALDLRVITIEEGPQAAILTVRGPSSREARVLRALR